MLTAEIEMIVVKWIAADCINLCTRDLSNQFLRMDGLAEFTIDQTQGQANLRWMPKKRFEFDYINSAMRMVGPREREIRLQVRGTVSRNGNQIILESLGDNTPFILLSPVKSNLTGYTIKANLDTHVLAPEVRQKFLLAERYWQVVTVIGPLFEPERSPPMYLIAEQVTVHTLGPNAIKR